MPVNVGQVRELRIDGLAHGGDGVGRIDGLAVFVPRVVPGDLVRVRLIDVRKTYARGAVIAVLEPGPGRITPACPVYGPCGGCQWQHIDYTCQLSLKTAIVRDALARLGGLAEVPVRNALGAVDPWGYRHKAQFPVGAAEGVSGGALLAGCFAPGTHDIVDIDNCLIQHPTSNRVLAAVKRLVPRYGVGPYDESTGRGLLRHVLVRVGRGTGEALVVLVINGRRLPRGAELAASIIESVPEVVGVLQNQNTRRTNVILGEETTVIAGRDHIIELMADLKFKVSALSFFQVNPAQAEVLYGVARDYAALTGGEIVADVYCGTGTIGLFLAKRAARVFGIEVVPEAVADARQNAALNGIDNAKFILGLAEEVLPRLVAEGARPDVIVFDPPRKGCEPAVLEATVQAAPSRMVYVSCNPATLARDLGLLAARGYRTVEVQPVDMFPHTYHTEAVALVEQRTTAGKRTVESKGHV